MPTSPRPPQFKLLDYLGHRWHSQADRPLADMSLHHRAHLMAELSFACYWAEEYVRELADHFGFADLMYFNFDGAQAYVLGNEHDTIVSCRGTEATDWNDIKADLKVWKVVSETVGRVHGGFKRETDDLWPALAETLRPNTKPLYFTGHSLGGAMAQICAARCRLAAIESDPVEIQTFGSPRVGDRQYIDHCKIKKIRWVNNNDFVPRFPPALFGYRHTGKEYYIDRHGDITNLTGLHRMRDGFASFLKGITSARLDHFADHLMPGYIEPLLKAARGETYRDSPLETSPG